MPEWSEARTIRELVLPALERSGWTSERIASEYQITDGRREVVRGHVLKGAPLRADLALLHPAGHPLAVIEAKKTARSEYDGIQQAKDYAIRLGLPVVYATNGTVIIEIDVRTGTQRRVPRYPSPDELWDRFRDSNGLGDAAAGFFNVPYSRDLVVPGTGNVRLMRYYQHRAVQEILRAIADGRDRILAVLATGTGKSTLAAQLAHVLWESDWPRGPKVIDPKPRVLYLADRDALLDDPILKNFIPIFGEDAVHRIQGEPLKHKNLYFALYQALDTGQIFAYYDEDYFDLVIIDECHRGSAREDSEWRKILDHFRGAVHLGLTATPRVDGEADNLAYFGDPVFTYSLKEGIEDGFLAPFQVIRAPLSVDIDGVHVSTGVFDDDGREIPEGDYAVGAFERTLILPERTQAAAEFLSDHLAQTDRMNKTVVFCVDQEHAARFAEAIGNLNSDLVAVHPYWATRITSVEGGRGKTRLDEFKKGDEPVPVVVTSSDLLTTGVDIPNLRNVVFFASVRSTARFKQMLGRGTRLDEDRGKDYFTVIDFSGVTAMFADPAFDGPPIREVEVEPGDPPPPADVEVIDAPEDDAGGVEVREPEPTFEVQPADSGDPEQIVDDPDEVDDIMRRGGRYVLSGLDVRVLGKMVYVVESAGALHLRAVRIEDWLRDRVLDLGYDAQSLTRQWANATTRSKVIATLGDAVPMSLPELADTLGHPEADPLDLLLNLAFDTPVLSRVQRAHRFSREQKDFLGGMPERARAVLEEVLRKYVEHGPRDLETAVLQVPPISELGSVPEVASWFGGPEKLQLAFAELNERLYLAS